MRRYSPVMYEPRRYYGGRGRSPPRRGYGGAGSGGYGRRREQNSGSLLVRNIPLDCRPEELRLPFERFGNVRDVYIPKDYYTGEPRGFAFVQFVDPYEAMQAQHRMNGQIFAGREISVVVAAEARKRPDEMRRRARTGGPSSYGGRSSYYGHSPSRSLSRSPGRYPVFRSRYRSRSHSPASRHREYSVSPGRRNEDRLRSLRGPPPERDANHYRRSYSPGHGNPEDLNRNGNAYDKKTMYGNEKERGWRGSPGRASITPPGSRSRSADISPKEQR